MSREHLTSWKGEDWTPDSDEPAAHPNSRYTMPISQCPIVAPEWDDPNGVPISAILFGGRRKTTVPLVTQARDWQHGTFMGATMSSEKTAAAAGGLGQVRRDPMAMLPFLGYNVGDYFQHWVDVGKSADAAKLPKIFYVNWFRRGDDGRFLWPGFGENSRVLKWCVERIEGRGAAVETPVGHVPTPDQIDLDGLDADARRRGRRAGRRRRRVARGDPAHRGVVRQDRGQAADLDARRARGAETASRYVIDLRRAVPNGPIIPRVAHRLAGGHSMSSSTPEEREGLRFSPWNLLLLLPFLMLVTPWFNMKEPQLFGMPYFYWVQFVWVVGRRGRRSAIVYVKTRDEVNPEAPGEDIDVDELDEGTRR